MGVLIPRCLELSVLLALTWEPRWRQLWLNALEERRWQQGEQGTQSLLKGKGKEREKANLAREVKKEREAKEESVPLLMNSWRRLMLRLLVTGALSRRWDGWTVMETWLKKFMMLTWPLLTKTSLTGLMNKKLRIAPTKLLK